MSKKVINKPVNERKVWAKIIFQLTQKKSFKIQ